MPRIEKSMDIARDVGIEITPTIVVDGWRFELPPTKDELAAMIRNRLTGKRPD
jgi:protein-disulfide isomerase